MKSRTYTLKRRAQAQEKTRQRIIEAAVELHSTQGPSRTTVSAIAAKAGVQRLTVYRHFPDEEALFAACSGHVFAQDPPPDPEAWRAVTSPAERLWRALGDLFAYYRRNRQLYRVMTRDADMPVLRKPAQRRREQMVRSVDVLCGDWPADSTATKRLVRAAIAHAVQFSTWDSLTSQELSDGEAVDMLVGMVTAVGADRR